METRYAVSPAEYSRMNAAELRQNFLLGDLFEPGNINLAYAHYDRIVVGGALPGAAPLPLEAAEELAAKSFLERREMGVINIGGPGRVTAGGAAYAMGKYDCLYAGRGTQGVAFSSDDAQNPACFYLVSAPAHRNCPTAHIPREKAVRAALGSGEACNERVIYKYILPGAVESCQLVMGLTVLAPGSVWNTMPCHTHERRMEAYLYFDVRPGQCVFHLMGPADETRHIVVKDKQAVLSPPWSIHSGAGTANNSFIWGMLGENQDFDDMQGVRL
ncbi:MAG: 5-dehydro-4-deoxy-D-glucuronate isomerase [Oscillospiraceae bacterium]|nr:5-dehydro-4-deoxy-D-glucuronate isomerase [Oscillospiraceae bacterium]